MFDSYCVKKNLNCCKVFSKCCQMYSSYMSIRQNISYKIMKIPQYNILVFCYSIKCRLLCFIVLTVAYNTKIWLVDTCIYLIKHFVKFTQIYYFFLIKSNIFFLQICSLLRGGIAERGGVRVGHRIIEINNQSVVAVPHEKIVSLLANSVGEVNKCLLYSF